MNEFDKRAEAYMHSVMQNDGDVFTRADLYEYIMNAWKAGYVEGNTTRNYFICNDCPKQKTQCMSHRKLYSCRLRLRENEKI